MAIYKELWVDDPNSKEMSTMPPDEHSLPIGSIVVPLWKYLTGS